MSEIEAKVRYVKLARSLKTYGVSFFLVKVKQQLPWPKLLFSISPSVVSPSSCYPSAHIAPIFPASPLSFFSAFHVCCLTTPCFSSAVFKPCVVIVTT